MQGLGFLRHMRAALAVNDPSAPRRDPADLSEFLADEAWSAEEARARYGALIDALDRAEAESNAKSRFLATVSHEIRTPLNGMLGLAALLQDTELTPEQENFVRAIRSSGGQLAGLVDDILDLARIESGSLAIEPEPADPGALVEDLVELLAPRAFARHIDIAAHRAPDLPAEVSIDAPRLRQVLLNLAGNAIKFTERGGVTISVAPSRAAPGDLVFCVADTGPGMTPEAVARLCAPATGDASPDSRPFHGAGLGLPIAGEIVRRMGGRINVESRVGGGAIVTFSLPCGAESLPAPKPVPDHKCLILTPDDIGAGVAARYLAELGIRARLSAVVHRASAVAAAASAAGQPYDFVLMDARISPAPGEALAAIREASGTRLPAAVLIEPGNRKSVPALREMGFDAFLVRPLRRASLLRIGGALLLGDGEFRVDPVVGDRATYRLAPQPVRALKVLVVDDNEINALLLRAIVERLGHHVEEARDGQAALAVASEHRCDLVLLDLDLPGMDGLSVARAIRGSGTRRPTLVAITGMNAADLESDAYDAGFDGFLEKPVDPEIVRDLIERMRVPGAA